MSYTNGKTPAERQALFNRCTFVNIHKDYDSRGRVEWQLFYGTQSCNAGFHQETFATRADAIAYAKEQFPSLEIWAERGAYFYLQQEAILTAA